jgi:hypothetical protein
VSEAVDDVFGTLDLYPSEAVDDVFGTLDLYPTTASGSEPIEIPRVSRSLCGRRVSESCPQPARGEDRHGVQCARRTTLLGHQR